MAERVSSDNPGVETVRAELVRAGRTDRPRVAVPADETGRFPEGEVVRLVLDGTVWFTPVAARTGEDRFELRDAHETPEDAMDPGLGSDHLGEWQGAHDLRLGGAVLVDVVEPGYKYGLRPPGERAFYDAGRPDSSLADIARDLDG